MEDNPDAGQCPSVSVSTPRNEIQERITARRRAGSLTRVTARKHRVRATGEKT